MADAHVAASDGEDGAPWRRHLQCVVCMEFTAAPVRPLHWPPDADCGVVFCARCHRRWARRLRVGPAADAAPNKRPRTLAPTCPRCRCDIMDTAERRGPDALLRRILCDMALCADAAAVSDSDSDDGIGDRTEEMQDTAPAHRGRRPAAAAAAAAPIGAARRSVAASPAHLRPVSLEAMQRWAADWESNGRLCAPAAAEDRVPHAWWTDRVITTTTLCVDDREAEMLWASPATAAATVAELDGRLGWSARLERHTGVGPWPVEGLAALFARTGCAAPAVSLSPDEVLRCRVAVAATAAIGAWVRRDEAEEARSGAWGAAAHRTRVLFAAIRAVVAPWSSARGPVGAPEDGDAARVGGGEEGHVGGTQAVPLRRVVPHRHVQRHGQQRPHQGGAAPRGGTLRP